MKFSRMVNAVETHTIGEPTRIVVGGIPNIKGKTMAEKMACFEKNFSYLRTALMLEPRGHNDMFGSVLTQPTSEQADLGVIFMHGDGYVNMCIHGSIGTATVAVETGIVPAVEPITELTLDTPSGLVKARVAVKNDMAESVTIKNVPSFLYKEGVAIDVPDVGKLIADISFGGSFFVIVDAKQLGLKVDRKNIAQLLKIGVAIKKAANEQITVQHPEMSHIHTIDCVEIYDDPTHPEAVLKNVVVYGDGKFDRSPCGTGTSAKMATLYAKGKLGLNQEFVYESIIGTLFRGRLLQEKEVCGIQAVIPEVTGSAYITGFSQYVVSAHDPLKHGFLLS